MMKKALALMLAAVMLIQPVAASAVTWGEVVSSLKSTGSYSDGSTSATMSGDVVSVTGGTLSDVSITESLAENYVFTDVVIDGEEFRIGTPDKNTLVQLKGQTLVNATDVVVTSYAAGNSGLVVHENASVEAEFLSMFANGEGDATLENMGTISMMDGGVLVHSWEESTGSMLIWNDGEINANYVSMDVEGETTGTVYNGGTITGSVHASANGSSTMTVENDGAIYGMMGVSAADNGVVQSAVNAGTIDGYFRVNAEDDGVVAEAINLGNNGVSIYAEGNGSAAVSQEGAGELNIGAFDNATVEVSNAASEAGSIYVEVCDKAAVALDNTTDMNYMSAELYDDAQFTLSNAADAETVYVWGEDASQADVQNDGHIDSMNAIMAVESAADVKNNGSIGEFYTDIYDNAQVRLTGEGSVDNSIIYINAPTADTYTAEQLKAVLANIKLPETTDRITELWTYVETEEGSMWTAVYAIDENGSITLVDDFATESEPVADNGPSKEMIKHWMEVQRQEEAIGGVYGSPYWLKQANLGYHSIEMRLYEEGEKILFRQYLDWMYNGTGDKRMTLRANDKELTSLMLYIDGKAIETLERTEITTITLVDYNYNPYMEYSVADIKAAREAYGLDETDTICIGAADAEVMKIGADGKLVPLEQGEETAEAEKTAA